MKLSSYDLIEKYEIIYSCLFQLWSRGYKTFFFHAQLSWEIFSANKYENGATKSVKIVYLLKSR